MLIISRFQNAKLKIINEKSYRQNIFYILINFDIKNCLRYNKVTNSTYNSLFGAQS